MVGNNRYMTNTYIYNTIGIRYDVSTRINGQGGEFFSPTRPTSVYMAIVYGILRYIGIDMRVFYTNHAIGSVFYRNEHLLKKDMNNQ